MRPAAFDARGFRARLAAEQITQRRFAHAARLHPAYVSRLLRETDRPGELARIKIADACQQLGLQATEVKRAQ